MEYNLIHKDAAGNINNSVDSITFLAFIKHATFAGINHSFFPNLPFRYASHLFEFMPSFLWSKSFQLLPELVNDPTETGYISNRIGRAFADFLSKKIYGARFTHSYECAMAHGGYLITGERPDFYCDSLDKQFAVEAKGFSKANVSDKEMARHKLQSTQGPLPVNFSVASVAYNLYKKPKIKFYDPVGDDIAYNDSLNEKLRISYYSSVLSFVKSISDEQTSSDFPDYVAFNIDYPLILVRQILIHKAIVDREWISVNWLNGVEQRSDENGQFYIDVDGIGLIIRS